MPRRPHQRKGRLPSVQRVERRLHGCAGCQGRNLDRLRRRVGVRIQPHGPAGSPLQLVEVRCRVNPLELSTGGRARSGAPPATLEPPRRRRVEHVRTLHPLGMPGRGYVFLEAW